jgi:Uncharacterized protein conserved in bacteria with the myosin-like domain
MPANQDAEPDDVKTGYSTAAYWEERLKQYKQKVEEKWSQQRDNLDKLYSREDRADSADREYSIFWANIEVLRPACYARVPVPVVVPRFKSGIEPQQAQIARSASEALERCLVTTFEQQDIDGCLQEVRDELLRYSRGTSRVRLAKKKDGTPCVEFDHFSADDFAHDPARTWREVKWVGFRAWLTRKQGIERFGDKFAEVPLKKRDKNSVMDQPDDQAAVWEIWCRESGMVHFYAEDYSELLEETEPWLDLTGFWPCPRPAYGTTVPKKLKPVPDILQYKDQIEEINEYTARIAALSEKLRLKGFYPAGAGELSEAIEAAMKSVENRAELIPISSFAGLGGQSFKDSIVWLPVKDVLELISGLVELRRVVIDDVYQITGISDILRGQTDPNETKGAQEIKASWGSMRVRGRQNEIARFARDMARIAAEIIAENFDPQTITAMAQMQIPPEVYAFLQNDRARGFIIEIETDSTIQPDEDAEKQRRVEFVTAVGTLFKEAAPMVMQAPQLGPFMGEVLKFAAQGFRAGRPLEGAIDQLVEQMKAQAAQPQPPKPDPELAKVEAQKAHGEQQLKQGAEQHQQKMQQSQQQFEQEMAFKQSEAALNREAQQQSEQQKLEASSKPQNVLSLSGDGLTGEFQKIAANQNEALANVTSALQEALGQMGQGLNALAQAIHEQNAVAAAPTELVRGKDGKAVGARKMIGHH